MILPMLKFWMVSDTMHQRGLLSVTAGSCFRCITFFVSVQSYIVVEPKTKKVILVRWLVSELQCFSGPHQYFLRQTMVLWSCIKLCSCFWGRCLDLFVFHVLILLEWLLTRDGGLSDQHNLVFSVRFSHRFLSSGRYRILSHTIFLSHPWSFFYLSLPFFQPQCFVYRVFCIRSIAAPSTSCGTLFRIHYARVCMTHQYFLRQTILVWSCIKLCSGFWGRCFDLFVFHVLILFEWLFTRDGVLSDQHNLVFSVRFPDRFCLQVDTGF